MPRKCCVPGCNSNYASQPGYVSVYCFPKSLDLRKKWIKAINRKDYEPGSTAVVCAKHFDDSFIIKEDQIEYPDGRKLVVPRKIWALTPDAVPTVFPNQPSYLTSPPPLKRKSPEEREAAMLQRDDEKYEKLMMEDKVKSFADLKKFCESHVPKNWICTTSETRVSFLKIDLSNCPTILMAIQFDCHLNVEAWKNGILISPSTYLHLLGTSRKCDTYMKFEAFLDFILLKENDCIENSDKIAFACRLLKECLEEEERVENTSILAFVCEQLKLSQLKTPRYSSDCLLWACTLLYSYPAAYRFIRNSGVLILPSPVYLKRFCSQLDSNCVGISKNMVNYLKGKFSLLSDREKIVNLLLDEIYVKPCLSYTNGIISGVAENTEGSVAASTIQVYMLSSVFSKNKDIVAMFPVRNLNSGQLFELTNNVLKMLMEIGYFVLSLISDNNRVNRNMFENFCGGNLKSCIANPFDQTKKLFFLFDTVHLIKCIRNNWINQKDTEQTFVFPSLKHVFFEEADSLPSICHASISLMKTIHENEGSKPVKKAHMLSRKVLYPTNLERQNVQHAVSLFHETNLAALETSVDLKNRMETYHFMNIISCWWKIVNVKHPQKGKRLRDKLCEAVVAIDDEKLQLLKAFAQWLDSWNNLVIGTPKYRHGKLTLETQAALLHTTNTLYELAVYLLKDLGAAYVLFGKFQTDNIEARFGQYRQMCGGNYNISVRQILESEKRLKIVGLLSLTSAKSGVFEIKQFLEDCGRDFDKPDVSTVHDFQNVEKFWDAVEDASASPLTQDEVMVVIYISGYVGSHVGACTSCKEILLYKDRLDCECPSDDVFKYLRVLDRGGLKWPKEFTVNVCARTLQIFKVLVTEAFEAEFLNESNHQRLLLNLTMESVCEILQPFQCECGKTTEDFARHCIHIMSNILLKNYCKLKNDKLSSGSMSQRKLSTLKRKTDIVSA